MMNEKNIITEEEFDKFKKDYDKVFERAYNVLYRLSKADPKNFKTFEAEDFYFDNNLIVIWGWDYGERKSAEFLIRYIYDDKALEDYIQMKEYEEAEKKRLEENKKKELEDQREKQEMEQYLKLKAKYEGKC